MPFTKLRNKIEDKRGSESFKWKTAVFIKDIIWFIIYYIPFIIIHMPFYLFFGLRYYPYKGKLPDFLIIGVAKGGTTSLWRHLKQHPNIEMSPRHIGKDIKGVIKILKEVNFFNKEDNWVKGVRWYKSLFNNNTNLQGEATPCYILEKICHERMHKVVPNAKLILLLRNPIDRAYSSYNHQKIIGSNWYQDLSINETFEEWVDKSNNSIFKNWPTRNIITDGFYIDQIENLLKYYPRENILILISEEMRDDPQKIYNKIYDFLKIEEVDLDHDPNVNKREYIQPMKKKTREKLEELYKPYNERLFKFLDYKIKEWIK